MTSRSSSTFICALALSLATPALLSHGQAAAPADASSSAATPAAAPAAPAAPAPMAAPAAAPAPEAAPAADASATAERPATYTMVAGDTLDSIAKKFDTSIHALAKLNKIPKSEFRKLRAGKVLQIPPVAPAPAAK
jgi:nucleoid-associated protein YgaU